jgi:hypothetical protein
MNFDISRLRRADEVAGGGAIALFIFMFFFHWYGVSTNVGTISGINLNSSFSGWHTFTNSRWVWLLTIIVALASVVATASARRIDIPVEPGVIVAGLGALSTLLILYRIIHHPTASASAGNFHATAGIKIGIWLGLIAAAAITYGGFLQMQAEGTSLSDVRDRAGDAFTGITVPAGGSGPSTGPSGGSAPASEPPPTPVPPTPSETPAAPPPETPAAPPPAAAPAPPSEAPPAPPRAAPDATPPIPPPAAAADGGEGQPPPPPEAA